MSYDLVVWFMIQVLVICNFRSCPSCSFLKKKISFSWFKCKLINLILVYSMLSASFQYFIFSLSLLWTLSSGICYTALLQLPVKSFGENPFMFDKNRNLHTFDTLFKATQNSSYQELTNPSCQLITGVYCAFLCSCASIGSLFNDTFQIFLAVWALGTACFIVTAVRCYIWRKYI